MRRISLIFLFSFLIFASVSPADSRQVRVNGRVASFESVLIYCNGDTAAAESISVPLPVSSPYYNKAREGVEHIYNTLNPAWICVFIAALGVLIPSSAPVCLLLLITLSATFAVRWWLSDSVPLTGITDIALCMAIIVGGMALFRSDLRRVLSLLITILMVCVALWSNHPAVHAVNPSLRSSWLPFHVTLMIIAYSLFLFSAASAVAGRVSNNTGRCIVIGEISLAAGILIGSLWAADAWGSYWSWDPKETAALVTLSVYLALLSVWKRLGKRATILRCMVIVAFLAVLLTWLGITGGLHSY